MDNRETLTPSSGDAILKRHLFSEVARNWIKGRGHIERAYFVRRPSRQSFGFRAAASSGPIPKAPGSAGGYLLGFDTPERGDKARCDDERRRAEAATTRLRGLIAGGGARLNRVSCSCRHGQEGTKNCNYGRLADRC